MRDCYFITTGNRFQSIEKLETEFESVLQNFVNVKHIRAGKVDSLLTSYYDLADQIDNDDAYLIFAHQDISPVLSISNELKKVADNLRSDQEFLRFPINNPEAWIKVAFALLERKDTGFLGVAGSLSLNHETAWWNHNNLSGAVIHDLPDGMNKINTYGRYGRVAVLDGLFLMAKRSTFRKLGDLNRNSKHFHFYDMELTLRANLAGLKNWTIPLLLHHKSGGANTMDLEWIESMIKFNDQFYGQLPLNVEMELLDLDLPDAY
jgi:Glycosyltransferase like family